MTINQACKLIGLTYEDIADEPYLQVFEMFADLGLEIHFKDRRTGKLFLVYPPPTP
jgi:hypothetical protein